MKHYTDTLKNGVRLITIPMKDNPAVTVMVFAGAGSNNEKKEERGLAHFLEHMCMKGGEKYPTHLDVSTTLDSLGAESNAFTGSEYTAYYAKGNPKHLEKMLAVVSDVYINPRIEESELEKEKGVIVEEINLSHDLPMERVIRLFKEVLYGDQPAGWSTLGTKKTVTGFKRDDFVKFKDKNYGAENTFVIISGDVNKKEVKKQVSKIFEGVPQVKPTKRKKPKENQKIPQLKTENRQTDQTHMVLGVRAFQVSDKRAPALEVLSAVLGKGMSSRLFVKLREEMGVCYYVSAITDLHDNYGVLAVRAGVDTNRLTEVTKEIIAELEKLKNERVEPKELKKAKEWLIGRNYLDLEASDEVAVYYASQQILAGEMKDPKKWAGEIRKVTAEDVQKVAKTILKNDKLNMAVVGNVKDEKALKKALKFS